LVQEGDAPAELPEDLIAQYERNMERFLVLVRKINETNSKTDFGDNICIADAIALRDCLGIKYHTYQNIYDSTRINTNRYSQKEIKYVRCIEPKELQKQIDKLAKEYRELDTKLQGINWTVDLM
jgi:hypothetical protein